MHRTLLAFSFAAAAALAVIARPLDAQHREPARPRLPAGADTNEAFAYFEAGRTALPNAPGRAADAFYWAARINPTMAEAFYGRRVALLLSDKRRLDRYWRGDKAVLRSAEMQQIDSLQLHALTLNPFFYRRLDGMLFDAMVRSFAEEAQRITGESRMEVEYHVENWWRTASVSMQAWRAYTDGQFANSLGLYALAIKQARKESRGKAALRADRGRLFQQVGQPDSALAELTLAVADMRKSDTKDVVYLYESKALMEQSIGLAHQSRGDVAAARAAFGRALEEDLSYAPAHLQIGLLALAALDTTAALGALETAVQLDSTDVRLRFTYGFALGNLGRVAEAERQLRAAVALNPVWAAPHYVLGEILEAQLHTEAALAEFRTFLALASRTDARRAEAMERLPATTSGAGQ